MLPPISNMPQNVGHQNYYGRSVNMDSRIGSFLTVLACHRFAQVFTLPGPVAPIYVCLPAGRQVCAHLWLTGPAPSRAEPGLLERGKGR